LQTRINLLTSQPFQDTFGLAAKRKKPRLDMDSVIDLATQAEERMDKRVPLTPECTAWPGCHAAAGMLLQV
jgi:hypothetical protein